MSKPERALFQPSRQPRTKERVSLYKNDNNQNVVWGSESNANFIDVLSVAPIGGIDSLHINETDIESDEFPSSTVSYHNGDNTYIPWDGGFQYVERTYALGKQAKVRDDETNSVTTFNRDVSSKGVHGVRVNFNTGAFTHRDKKNRRRIAEAFFVLSLLNESGQVVSSVSSTKHNKFFASNPTSVQLSLVVPEAYRDTIWTYKVTMSIKGHYYGTQVAGNWSAATATELYQDTHDYKNVAVCSGKIVAGEVGSKTPKRQYLVRGYKVLTPMFQDVNGKQVFTGNFDRNTSDSYAWNIMAVLTDTKWGAGNPLDKINISSFLAFDEYCSELINGVKRYSHSQYLIKQDNYFKLASQMAGAADGKLYEDTSGRIGILVDKKSVSRRVVTSYDVLDEKIKRTTVPESKKINYVEGEFDDKTNKYKKTILDVSDQNAITKNGLISKKIKLDGCTDPKEAYRVINRLLVTSQVATSSYVLAVGHTHEDAQIGDILEVYDRKYARANYCGKVGTGSTTSVIQVDKRTAIDLSMMSSPAFVVDNNRGEPIVVNISSWTEFTITLQSPINLAEIPPFTSFGVKDLSANGLKPTLMKVVGTDDKEGAISLECVEYNHSLYDHVDNGTPLVITTGSYIPPSTQSSIGNLVINNLPNSIRATWDALPSFSYSYYWKRYGENDPSSGMVVKSGDIASGFNTVSLDYPLDPVVYKIFLTAKNGDELTDTATALIDLAITDIGNSTLAQASGLGVKADDGTSSGEYDHRYFTVVWTHTDTDVKGFTIKVSQDGTTFEKYVDGNVKELYVSESDLIGTFGIAFKRQFILSVITVDKQLLTTLPVVRTVNNPPPVAPTVSVAITGDISLVGTPPDDAVGSIALVWVGNVELEVPLNALVHQTEDIYDITLPDGTVIYNGDTYAYKVAWYDSFGTEGLNYGKQTFEANPDLMVPVAPELTESFSIRDTMVKIDFTHDGTWLRKMKVYIRVLGETTPFIESAEVLLIPVDVNETTYGYDAATGEGYFFIDGLSSNREYEFYCTVANEASSYSADSNIIEARGLLAIDLDKILDDVDSAFGGIDPRELIAEGIIDAFDDLDLEESVIRETIERNVEDGKMIADITRLQAVSDTENSKTLARHTDLIVLVANEKEASATRVELLETEFETEKTKTSASISTVTKAISDETSARALQVDTLETSFNNKDTTTNSRITTLESSISDPNSASAQRITTLEASVDDEVAKRKAEIIRVEKVITDETSARATDVETLEASITGVEEDVASVLSSSTAAIGWCGFNSVQSSHETKGSCEAAGGVWTATPFAEAVRRVQVTSGADTATVGSMYTAFVDLDGKITGKATVGVNVNNEFTGLEIVGGSSISKMIFKGNVVEFKDTAGTVQLSYANGTWKFAGHLTANTGTIAGWNINTDAIYAGTYKSTDGYSIDGITLSKTGALRAKNFRIDLDGSAYFRGDIDGSNITGGTIIGTKVEAVSGTNGAGTHRAVFAVAGGFTGLGPSQGSFGVHAESSPDGWVSYGVYAVTKGEVGTRNAVRGISPAGGSAFYAEGAGTSYSPFTGSHEGLLAIGCNDFEQGDIICDVSLFNINDISNAICVMGISTKPNQKNARGVYIHKNKLDSKNIAGLDNEEETAMLSLVYDNVAFNSLGEGAMNICGENGDLESGDLIATSSMMGKGMRQDGDIITNRTVAEVRHDVTFDSPDQVKQVAVIYRCG
ncbi:central tail fiber J [Colwellia phage 9A]|uniref:Tail protein n=1 Tax=Colwellia phage 9A TaxID=765765 RepID=I3UMD4_9CAUD|nr:central tail fiber J [Colwellia phage 9A]AFK66649.1 tail protein [Colwellia phage 9A]